jgi:hypothetical protein
VSSQPIPMLSVASFLVDDRKAELACPWRRDHFACLGEPCYSVRTLNLSISAPSGPITVTFTPMMLW